MDKDQYNQEEILDSHNMIQSFIDEELKTKELHQIFIGGFSQGASMALYTGLRQEQYLAGIIVFNGYNIPFLPEKQCNANILVSLGKKDDIINYDLAMESFKDIDSDIDFQVNYDSRHDLNGYSLEILEDFLNRYTE